MYEYKWEYHKSEIDEVYKWHIFFNGACFAKAISEMAAKQICEEHNINRFKIVMQRDSITQVENDDQQERG